MSKLDVSMHLRSSFLTQELTFAHMNSSWWLYNEITRNGISLQTVYVVDDAGCAGSRCSRDTKVVGQHIAPCTSTFSASLASGDSWNLIHSNNSNCNELWVPVAYIDCPTFLGVNLSFQPSSYSLRYEQYYLQLSTTKNLHSCHPNGWLLKLWMRTEIRRILLKCASDWSKPFSV